MQSDLPHSLLLFSALLTGLLLGGTSSANAQLRPMEPLSQDIWNQESTWSARLGASFYQKQRASLAGLEGSLVDLGDFRLLLRRGSVVLEASGTVRRLLKAESRFAEPSGGAVEPEGEWLKDAGDYRIATAVRLTPENEHSRAYLRFGTRLPTTDNGVGMERDQIDFFASLGGATEQVGLSGSAEVGVGINGTREPTYEQSDVLSYGVVLERANGLLRPSLSLVGHFDGRVGMATRGNEELAEVQLGLKSAIKHFTLEAQWVQGLTDFSPGSGVRLFVGLQH